MPDKFLKKLQADFDLGLSDCRKIISAFSSEMSKGLAGQKSSLKMIPAYVDVPAGSEQGRFIAIDLGGTNLRVLEIELNGRGGLRKLKEKKYVIDKKHTLASSGQFFGFIADKIKGFVSDHPVEAGFTFSFPVKQTAPAAGVLIRWNKDFAVRGAVGKDVVGLLNGQLLARGLPDLRITALVNDTVGTLVCRGYSDRHCDVGLILGTGTNACYREDLAKIGKWKGPKSAGEKMIINIEWGDFDQIKTSPYDKLLDRQSANPGKQILEKMVGGMYLGEVARLVLVDLVKRKMLFSGQPAGKLSLQKSFKSEYLSVIEADSPSGLRQTRNILSGLGIKNVSRPDARLVKNVCELTAKRASIISAACLAAVIKHIDRNLKNKHTVAIDGSVYEKHPVFAKQMRKALQAIFGQKAQKIKMALTKDGSGVGAAVIAAVAGTKKSNSAGTHD